MLKFLRTRDSKRIDYLIAAATTLLAFFVYLRTLAPTVLPADSGEFQFAAPRLGIAHPTGYPLYLLLGKLFTLLPIGDVAYRVNLMSAVFAALTVGTLYFIVTHILSRTNHNHPKFTISPYLMRTIGVLTALLFASSHTFWSQAVIAEVYTLNAFFVSALFYLLLQLPHTNRHLPITLALIYGLSLTHHRSMLLLAPAFFGYVVLTDRAIFRRPRLSLACMVSVIAPLALYLYIPLRAAHTPWLNLRLSATRELALYENTWRGFYNFVLGREFSGLLGYRAESVTRLWQTLLLLLQQYDLIGVILGGLGLVALVTTRRWRLLFLTLLSYLTIIIFCAVYFIDDIAAYYIPSYLIFAIWIGKSADLRIPKLPNQQMATYLLIGLLAGSVTRQVGFNYHRVDQSDNFATHERWQAILADAPENAILLTNDRDEMVPLYYYQYVEHRRRDLTGLFPQITPAAEYANVISVTDTALRPERPACFIKPMAGLELKYRLEPRRVLTCIENRVGAKAPQYIVEANFANILKLVGVDLEKLSNDTKITLNWRVLETPTENYVTFVHLLDRDGEKFVQSDHQPGGVYYPPLAWQAGEYLRDTHVITASCPISRIIVGVYEPYTRQRLKVIGDERASPSNHAVVDIGR